MFKVTKVKPKQCSVSTVYLIC